MSVVDEIKDRLDLIDVVSGYISLQKAGHNYKALCPFHGEKTPSLVVFPDTQTWRCFGCGKGGDVFSFVMEYEGWEFREALGELATRAGVELDSGPPVDRAEEKTAERLYKLLDEAAQWYLSLLLESDDARQVRNYVFQQRGLNEDSVRRFALGFAPDNWRRALDYFRERGYSLEEMLGAGLVTQKEDSGRTYDRFRNRLMIPIRDGRGRTVGFGARALGEDQNPKYLNSPQGRLFDKSGLLYGMDVARRAIREQEQAIVVEGYMDVIQAHQAGYENVVAQMGTSLTDTQIQLLAKYAHRLILALDSDAAGVNATMRGLNVAQESLTSQENTVVLDPRGMFSRAGRLHLDLRILHLPSGKDPDDFIRSHPDEWPSVVAAARPLVDYVIDIGTRSLSKQADIYERERVARELLPLLMATENDLQRNQNVQRLAMRLRIPERELLNWAANTAPDMGRRQKKNPVRREHIPQTGRAWQKGQNGHNKASPVTSAHRHLALEQYCLAILLERPMWLFDIRRQFRELAAEDELAAELLDPLDTQDFSREDYRSIFRLICDAVGQDEHPPEAYIETFRPAELGLLFDEIRNNTSFTRFQNRATPIAGVELSGIKNEDRRLAENVDSIDNSKNEFLRRVLELRTESLRQQEAEYYFLIREMQSQESDPETEALIQTKFRVFSRAKRIIESAIHQSNTRR